MAQPHRERREQTAPKTLKSSFEEPRVAPFMDHIRELRARAFWVAIVFIAGSALAYQFQDRLVTFALAPLGHQKLVYLTPGGGFNFIFQLTMVAGGLLAAPFLIYHLYKFVVPALPERAHKHTFAVFVSSVLLMISGAAFGYYVAVPAAMHFLTNFAASYITANLTADSYLNFVLAYIFGLGILFQLPLLLIFWHWITPLSPRKLLNTERYIILAAFVLAAMITPTPDVFNQCVVALPIILIYQIGVVAIIIMGRHSKTLRTVTPPRAKATLDTRIITSAVPVAHASLLEQQLHSALHELSGETRPHKVKVFTVQSKQVTARVNSHSMGHIAKTAPTAKRIAVTPSAAATKPRISHIVYVDALQRPQTNINIPRVRPRPAPSLVAVPARTGTPGGRFTPQSRVPLSTGYSNFMVDGFGVSPSS